MAVKISLYSEEESGRPLLSGLTKAFQVTSVVVVGFSEESALCSLVEELSKSEWWHHTLLAVRQSCQYVKCAARKVLTSPIFRLLLNIILLLPLLRLCPGSLYT